MMYNIEVMKVCSKCKTTKEYLEFGNDRSTKSGYSSYCKPCIKLYRKADRKNINRISSEWRKQNKEKCNQYYMNRYNNDPLFKLRVNLRNRLNMALKKNQKTGSAVRDLGCTVEELAKYLESQFYSHPATQQPMTWDNWGRGKNKWNIDHIAEFQNMESTEDLKAINHYSNLRPLWHIDHIAKNKVK